MSSECGDWTYYQRKEKCYRRFARARTWDEAKMNCVEKGGTLVSIPDEETQNFLKNKVSPGLSFWAGATPCCDGSWRWLDGTPWSYTNWRMLGGYPEDGNDQRLFFKDGILREWITYPLNEKRASICQYQYVPDDAGV